MKITDAFLGEHAVFYAQFNYLEKTISETESTDHIKNLAAMLSAALATHANLEEELLFMNLEPHLGTQGGPLVVMRVEHNEIEGNLERLLSSDKYSETGSLLLRVVQVARQHFAKEEEILYPIAQQVLGEQTLIQLGDEWAKRRSVCIQAQGLPGCH